MTTQFLPTPGLKIGMDFRGQVWKRVWKMTIFWSETGSGFGEAGGTSQIPRNVPPLPRWEKSHVMKPSAKQESIIIQNISWFEKLLMAVLNFLQYNHSLTSSKQPLKMPRFRGLLQSSMIYQSHTTGGLSWKQELLTNLFSQI